MKLLGFNFNKINIEKFSPPTQETKINTSVDVSEINSPKTGFFKPKGEIMEIKFSYTIEYSPNIAKIELSGAVAIEVESKMAREVLKQWKEKKLADDFKIPLFNLIIRKANIKALQLEDEMNLPYHIPFPTLKAQEKKE